MYDEDEDEDGPEIAGYDAILVEVEQGKAYTWCQCGRSSEQPWCDGVGHLGTAYNGQIFRPTRTGRVRLCTCKRTKNPPYCDDTHKNLVKPG